MLPRITVGPIEVMSVKAIDGTHGAKAAFDILESKLQSLKGRRFYGTYNPFTGEYRACVVKLEGEKSEGLGLEDWVIPGGDYVTRKVDDWTSKMDELPRMFDDLATTNPVDTTRPSLEFYRSQRELVLYLPVKKEI